MKKAVCVLLSLLLWLFAGCKQTEKQEIVVFAAASLQESLPQIARDYMADHDVEIVLNFDSSGTLRTQILEGAQCHIFLSAGQKQVDGLGMEQFDLLENQVTLVVPDGNPAGIQSYEDLKNALTEGGVLMAMGNADVPVGQYTKKILDYFGLSEADLAAKGLLTYGSNAREVTLQVAEGTVDCGIVYATDAIAADLTVVDTATEAMCGRVVYPAAMLSADAAEFFRYLKSPAAKAVLEAAGFTPLG